MKQVKQTHRATREGRVEITYFDSGVKVRALREPSQHYVEQQMQWQTAVLKNAIKQERRRMIEGYIHNKSYREAEKHLIATGIIDPEE